MVIVVTEAELLLDVDDGGEEAAAAPLGAAWDSIEGTALDCEA